MVFLIFRLGFPQHQSCLENMLREVNSVVCTGLSWNRSETPYLVYYAFVKYVILVPAIT